MRQDEQVGSELRGSDAWDRDPQTGVVDNSLDSRVEAGDEMVDGKLRVHSLSGHERNKLYLNEGGSSIFSDQSGLSGLDDEALYTLPLYHIHVGFSLLPLSFAP